MPIRAFHEPDVTVPRYDVSHGRRLPPCERARAPRRRGRRQRPARPGGGRQRPAGPGGAGPGHRPGGLRARRAYVDVSWFDPHVKRARLRARGGGHARLGAAVVGQRITELGRDGGRHIALAGPTAPGPVRRRRPGARRPRPPALGARGDRGDHGGAGQLDRGAVPQPGLGGPRPPGPRARRRDRAPVGGDRPRLPPRRAGPGGGVARPRRGAARPSAERLNARRLAALRFVGPGTDLTVGLLPGSRWVGGGDHRRDGLPPPAEHPHRGGVHDPRPGAHRGPRHLHPAARRGRHDHRGPAGALRGRPGGRDRRRLRRRRAARRAPPWTRAPRASARSRWWTAAAASARSASRLLRHAARRERREPHRPRRRLPEGRRPRRRRRGSTTARSTSTS